MCAEQNDYAKHKVLVVHTKLLCTHNTRIYTTIHTNKNMHTHYAAYTYTPTDYSHIAHLPLHLKDTEN